MSCKWTAKHRDSWLRWSPPPLDLGWRENGEEWPQHSRITKTRVSIREHGEWRNVTQELGRFRWHDLSSEHSPQNLLPTAQIYSSVLVCIITVVSFHFCKEPNSTDYVKTKVNKPENPSKICIVAILVILDLQTITYIKHWHVYDLLPYQTTHTYHRHVYDLPPYQTSHTCT